MFEQLVVELLDFLRQGGSRPDEAHVADVPSWGSSLRLLSMRPHVRRGSSAFLKSGPVAVVADPAVAAGDRDRCTHAAQLQHLELATVDHRDLANTRRSSIRIAGPEANNGDVTSNFAADDVETPLQALLHRREAGFQVEHRLEHERSERTPEAMPLRPSE